MASNLHIYEYDGLTEIIIKKWKIRVGSQLMYNSVILSYKPYGKNSTDVEGLLKYKSNVTGTVVELLVKEGDLILGGVKLLKVEPCTHPVIMKDLCGECGADLRHLDHENFEKLTSATTFSMVHVVPELKVCLEQAEKLGRDDETRLLKDRKLVLLVDLDQTLIHTTNDNVPKNLPDVYHFQLYGPNSPWYHTKLRPGTKDFLKNISKYYELHICTFGARLYAHKIAQILDPDRKLFSHRILSRDECFDANSKTANLKALFPRGDDMVCIIDDREDVWNFAPNVVHVKPYCYFHNTGDINAPPFAASGSNISNASSVAIAKIPTAEKSGSSSKTDSENLTNSEKTKESSELKSNNQNVNNIAPQDNPNKNIVACDKDDACKETGSEDSPEEPASNGEVTEDKAGSSSAMSPEKESVKSDTTIEFPPPDDYLLYLEEILQNIHKKYYKTYDRMKAEGLKSIPDLKIIVPDLKRTVLKGCNIVFSSSIPTNHHPETHRFWIVAESLGAHVTVDLVLDSSENQTTHVVGSKPGTKKVNAAMNHGNIFIVGLDWLFCCAERWERADERLFPLTKDISAIFLEKSKQTEGSVENSSYDPVEKTLKVWPGTKRPHSSKKKKSQNEKKTEEEIFSERIFVEAGLSLSQDDIEDMDKEIEEACSGEDKEIEEACSGESDKEIQSSNSSDSSEESLSSADYPKGWKRPKKDFTNIEENEFAEDGESSDVETIGSVDEEMAEAVKQEFGS